MSELSPLALAMLVALCVDAMTGELAWLYRRLPHPVVVVGRLVTRLERCLLDPSAAPRRQRLAGIMLVAIVVGVAALAGSALQALCLRLPLGSLWLGLLASSLLAWRSLHEHVRAVAEALRASLAEGRRAVAHICGRDPEALDAGGVGRAAVESLAENFADGVVAPLLWGLLLGLPGMLAYKAVNTLDSMVGHRTPRHRWFGWASARLDDLVNLPASRLSALLILLAACAVPGADPRRAWRTVRRDARLHRSPNAGWPEAAVAGALALRLAGPRAYGGVIGDDPWIGDGKADVAPDDIDCALILISKTWFALALLPLLVAVCGL